MTVRDRDILDALLDVFSERGCFNTNVDAVAATVGIGKGSLYRRFPSREALCRAALDHGVRGLAAQCRLIWEAEPDAPPAARLLAVLAELVALNERNDPHSPSALLRLSCSNRWTVNGQAPEAPAAAFVPLVEEWQAAGLCNPAESPQWIAAVLLGLVSALPLTAGDTGGQSGPLAARLAALLQRAFVT